jgi:predicted nucleic acid-binding protein
MQIMLDANIIVSAILFPQSPITKALKHMISNYKLVLSRYTVDEIEKVFNKKFPHRINEIKNFMEKIPYEL